MPDRHRHRAHSRVPPTGLRGVVRAWLVYVAFAFAPFGIEAASAETSDAHDSARPAINEAFLGGYSNMGVGTSQAGNLVLGELGPRYGGFKSVRRGEWLLVWELLLAAKAGYVRTAGPLTRFLGGRILTQGEIGYRHLSTERWSPYVGTQGRFDLQLLRHPGISRYALNDMDGISGRTTNARVRVDFGASLLDDTHCLLLIAFVQESLRPTETRSGVAFTEAGMGARYTAAYRWTASLEASWGRARESRIQSLGLSDQTTHKELAATLKVWLLRRMWFELNGAASRNTDRLVYSGSGATYYTANVPNLSAAFAYGLSLGL